MYTRKVELHNISKDKFKLSPKGEDYYKNLISVEVINSIITFVCSDLFNELNFGSISLWFSSYPNAVLYIYAIAVF